MPNLESPVVSVDWLAQNLNNEDLIILDASIKKVTGNDNNEPNNLGIPGSLFFDIKHNFSKQDSDFPNTWPTAEQFQTNARSLGINNNSAIVVYDDKGIYSSARAWYMLRAFGHENVAILNGGLPQWKKKGYTVEERQTKPVENGNFEAELNKNRVVFFNKMQSMVDNASNIILDARSAGRFKGSEKEPRKGLRSGTIPGSQSLPYNNLMDEGLLKNRHKLEEIFKKFKQKEKPFVFSCGSGITACVLALGAELSGFSNYSIYDGSWTEWGTLVKE